MNPKSVEFLRDFNDWRRSTGPYADSRVCSAGPSPKVIGEAIDWACDQIERMQSQAATDVLAERRRQIDAEGWTPEHDDEHSHGEMARAAAAYAMAAAADASEHISVVGYLDLAAHKVWPWDRKWWKPTTPRCDLVKAAALILAEIERRDRMPLPPLPGETK
jgi:hypothetical protein